MKVKLGYFAQVRQAAGTESECLEIPEGGDLIAALRKAAEIHGEPFRDLVLSEGGEVRPGLLILINSAPVPRGSPRRLAEDDEVAIFSPVSGG